MKNKPVLISIIILSLLISCFLIVKSRANSPEKSTQVTTIQTTANSQAQMSVIPADKIEVVHFHGTQQCASCIAVGKFAKQTIEGKFPDEVKSGKIVFRDINGDLPENEALVKKFQARGSSLFVNAIRSDKDDITEDATVWRLVNNETQYITYFESKLNGLLGK